MNRTPNEPTSPSRSDVGIGTVALVTGVGTIGGLAVSLTTMDGAPGSVRIMFASLAVAMFGAILVWSAKRTQRAMAEQLERHRFDALHDRLTKLPNRTLFDDRVSQVVKTTRRSGDNAAVVVFDLDRFKETNDTLGNQAGDRVLREVGNRLAKRLRASDTVARLGGNEFGVVLSTVAGATSATRLAEDLRRAISAPIMLDGVPVIAEASVGIALIGEQEFPPATYVQRAERAVRRAKADRSGIAVHDESVDDAMLDQLSLVAELRTGIARGELRLFYQPKARLSSGAVKSVEALVRWEHPKRGMLPPNLFIPLAERTGLMRPLTYWVLDEAMRQAREWAEGGRGIRVAVNLSQQSLLDETIHAEVQRVLERHQLPAKALEIEITESALVSDLGAAKRALERLDEQGVSLSIDDYGTGHSSLSHVRELPVGCIKIDRSFVSGMVADPANAAIVRSTIALARDLGMRVVAEGVETEEEWATLRELGCHYAQGYLINRPQPAGDFAKWLDDNDDRFTGPSGRLPAFA